jgi:hypothetical protein
MRKNELDESIISKVVVEYINYFSPITEIELSEETIGFNSWKYFLDRLLKKIKIQSWKKNYINDNILDGFAWRITITSHENKIITFYGQNDYPDNWDNFYRLVEKVEPLNNEKEEK